MGARHYVLVVLTLGIIASCGDEDRKGLDDTQDQSTDSETEDFAIPMDCSDCPAVGPTLENMVCAFDICDPDVVISNEYQSLTEIPTVEEPPFLLLEDTYEAVSHFGEPSNNLAPALNDSYGLIATGRALDSNHSDDFSGNSCLDDDPYSTDTGVLHDVMEWTLRLRAPEDAHSFRFKYVFFSQEYDEFICSIYNDKFYVILEAASTDEGEKTVINFAECRSPEYFWDFVCGENDTGCVPGKKYCFVAINTALSECCWYPTGSSHAPFPDDPPCPDGTFTTDITGTNFECAPSVVEDDNHTGSSTGWLKTAWWIEGGEEFTLTFHIHDTHDAQYDSEVILDAFEFLSSEEHGTTKVE